MSTTKVPDSMLDLTETVTITSTDAGAAAGPTLELYRDSASPAAADDIGQIAFQGEDSAGNLENYARIKAIITDPTSTSEDAKLVMQTVVAGTLAARVNVGAGMWAEGVTGGDPGAGKANFTDIQKAGVALPVTLSYTSPDQTITSGGALTLAHSLGVKPKLVQTVLKCVTGEAGYSIGDEIIGPAHMNATDAESSRGVSLKIDATNVTVRFGSAAGAFATLNGTTGTAAVLTNANWSLIVKAFA